MKNFKLLLKTLYKNESAIEAGRSLPWWSAILFLFVAMFISIIPIMASTLSVDGGSFISASTMEVDKGLTAFTSFLDEKNLVFPIDGTSKKLNINGNNPSLQTWNETIQAGSGSAKTPLSYKFTQTVMDTVDGPSASSVEKLVLEVYNFTNYSSSAYVTENINRILTHSASDTTLTLLSPDDVLPTTPTTVSSSNIARNASFMVLSKDGYAVYKFSYNSTTYTSASGNYNNMTISSLKEVTTWDQWKTFFTNGYLDNKNYVCVLQTTIILAVNTGLTLLMGLMIFIMTRGKNNPFRIYKFGESIKISVFASLSPAIISMVFGFIASTFATMAYVLIFGVRIMYLTMKNLRPQIN